MLNQRVLVLSYKAIEYDNRVQNQIKALRETVGCLKVIIPEVKASSNKDSKNKSKFTYLLKLVGAFCALIIFVLKRLTPKRFFNRASIVIKSSSKHLFRVLKRLIRGRIFRVLKRLIRNGIFNYISKVIYRNIFNKFTKRIKRYLPRLVALKINIAIYKKLKLELENQSVHTILYANDLMTLPAAVFAKLKYRTKLVYDMHEYEMHRYPPKSKLQKLGIYIAEELLLPVVDRVTTVSFSIKQDYKARFPRLPINLVLSAAPVNSDVVSLYASDHYTDYIKNYVYTGYISEGRNIEHLLRYAEVNPEISITFIGQLREQFDLRHRFLDKIAELPNVFYLPPILPSELPSFCKNFDGIICSYDTSIKNYDCALPNKLMLAINLKLEAVVSDSTEVRLFEQRHKVHFTKFFPKKNTVVHNNLVELSAQSHAFYALKRQDTTIHRLLTLL